MSTHAIRTNRRVSSSAIASFLALLLAASVLAVQGHSIWSTTTHPVVRPGTVHVDPHPFKNDLRPDDLRPGSTHGGSSRPSMSQIEARKGG